jgi:proteasome lid subunit RPN8/RPN11
MTQTNLMDVPQSQSALQDQRPQRRRTQGPVLRFTPTAWAKLQYFCHRGDTEIGGFAITAADDLLLVEDFVTVCQSVSGATVAFDDTAVAEFFEAQVDAGRRPEQFARIWAHSHPGKSPTPSSVDEETFDRVFGACDWAIMFILARNGATYARLRFNVGPGGAVAIPVEVDYSMPFSAADHAAWEAEYQANIFPEIECWGLTDSKNKAAATDRASPFDLAESRSGSFPGDLLADLQAMEPAERRLVLDELAARPELWSDNGDLRYG